MVDAAEREELARHAWGLLMAAAQPHLETTARELERLGLSKVMAAFLNAIATMPVGPTNQLAVRFGVNPAWVTDIVDRLEARGEVRRSVSPDDRRVKLLELTETGRATQREVEAIFATPPGGLVESPVADLRALVRIAERMRA
jgi:DNA-binding MarR family transcriptional regulator